VVATINITTDPPTPGAVSPLFGSTVDTAVVTFSYNIIDTVFGVGSIEYSTDGVHFVSILQGEHNQELADSMFFPFSGTFDIELAHGSYTLHFRAIDRLNNVGPEVLWDLDVDISTTITIDPLSDFTNNSTLIVTGTREVGATVTVTRNAVTVPGVSYPTATTWQVTVILQEGNNVIVATATDVESNTATATDSIILDTIAPAPPIVTEVNPAEPNYDEVGGTVFTNQSNQTLVGNKEANTAVYLNDVLVVALNSSVSFSIPVVLVEGLNELHLKTEDQSGNFSSQIVVSVVLDTIPPQTPSIVINDGVAFTLRRDVTLELSATGDPTHVKYSEDINFTNIDFVPFTGSPMLVPFVLSRGGGTKIVYAVFKDAVGNETIPVFDSIILPSTVSAEVDRADTMTIQDFDVTPEDDYLIRLQDNRNGTFSVEVYAELLDAINQTNRRGSVISSIAGEQTLTLIPDFGGIDPGGTIRVTLVTGAETIIYRFRTDVFDPSVEEIGTSIVYTIKEYPDFFDAQAQVPIFEGSALGRVEEINVGGDPRRVRISKAFQLHNEDTAIVQHTYYTIVDQDGPLFPIIGARFHYPLMTSFAEVLSLEEEPTTYLITLDRDFTRFNSTFGYEMTFSKRRKLVTDYRIFRDGRVEYFDESGISSGNVRITYASPQFITSVPSSEFKPIYAPAGSTVTLTVQPTNNLILLSDLDKVSIRFFHSLQDINRIAPSSITVTVNDSFTAVSGPPRIITANARARIYEFSVNSTALFPGGIPMETYGYGNTVLQKVAITFVANANVTFSDEAQVIAEAVTISSNCRVIVNGEEKFLSTDRVTGQFDNYEFRVQSGIIDVFYNDQCIYTQSLDINGAIASIGAGARVDGDAVNASFTDLTTIHYLDTSPSALSLAGRFVEIEANLRKNSTPLLRSFEFDFESAESVFPPRLFIPETVTAKFFDTATVAIIGIGHREETLVRQGSGEEDEGRPVDFDANNIPDGRHFRVVSFPIVVDTLKVFLTHNAIERLLQENIDYHTNLTNGYVVLFHPIALSDHLRVTYTSEADSNTPGLFTDIDDIVAQFGTPSLENTLSLGAQIALENGAKRILAVQALDPAIDAGWARAYDTLAKEEAYFIVPIPPSNYPLVVGNGLDHVENQSSTPRRGERVLVLGETDDFTSADLSLFRDTFRTIFLRPSTLTRVVNGETALLDGRFMAAAYAGKFSSLNLVSEPMTGKELVGFNIDKQQKFTNIELENLAKDGITMIRRLTAGGKVFRSITTSSSLLAVEQEQSLVRVRDFLAINIRRILEDRFVGQVIASSEILEIIAAATKQFLEFQISQRLVTRYTNVRVKIDDLEPRQVNVAFDVEPVFPLNNIALTVRVVTRI